jgi:anti-anti-sigma factor
MTWKDSVKHGAEVWRLAVDSGGDGETDELVVRGRLGLSGAAELDAVLDGFITRGGRNVLLDLSGVDYLSSPGLRLLDDRARELEERGGTLSVRQITDPVRLALDLAGLERLYRSHASGEP